MLHLDADEMARLLDRAALIEALDAAFRAAITVPQRHHHTLRQKRGRDATLLLMPAWDDAADAAADDGTNIGIKIATVFPDNGERGLPAVQASYLLLDRRTGAPLAVMEGAELTARRTAAASALAARYLSPEAASHLLMIGTGVLAPHLIASHRVVRPITKVTIWGRNFAKAKALAEALAEPGLEIAAVDDLGAAVPAAHIVSAATLARDPLIRGDWLVAGQHLDLVGAFTPEMREADDTAVRRARVYVDTEACLTESGEISQPIASGALDPEDVQGDLFSLARGGAPGRRTEAEITLFKSAGTAIEDLAAARLAYERHRG